MTNAADIVVMALAIAGGGAIGAALGGGLSGALDWTGGRLHAALLTGAALGAGAGLFFAGGAPMPDLAALMPKFGAAADAAETERVLKTYYPSDYAQVKSTMDQMKARNASDAEVESALRAVALPLMKRQVPLASTENALAYLAVAKDEQAAMARDPQLCFRAITDPSPATLDAIEAAMPQDLKLREARLATKVLEQTATKPQPPRPSPDLEAKLKIWAIDSVGTLPFGERDDLGGAHGGDAQAKAACDVLSSMIGLIAVAPPDDAAEAFKALTAKGMQQVSG
jgi:hypothetical protein